MVLSSFGCLYHYCTLPSFSGNKISIEDNSKSIVYQNLKGPMEKLKAHIFSRSCFNHAVIFGSFSCLNEPSALHSNVTPRLPNPEQRMLTIKNRTELFHFKNGLKFNRVQDLHCIISLFFSTVLFKPEVSFSLFI